MSFAWVILFAVLSVLTLSSISLSAYIFIYFKKLSRGVGKTDLLKLLARLSEIEKLNSDNIKIINKEIEKIKKEDLNHIQKMSLIRFNPFSELGGEHSFSLALLDARLSGIIITGLHTRERTRVYIKKIILGKCKQDLSKEEKEALAKVLTSAEY